MNAKLNVLTARAFRNSAVPLHPSPYSCSDNRVIGPFLRVIGSSQFVRGSRQRHREGRVDDVSGTGLQTREMELVSLGRLPGREEESDTPHRLL